MATSFRYIALGDSTAVGIGAERGGGYPARLAARLRTLQVPARLENLGLSGATTADVVSGRAARAAAARPDLITLAIGGNDAWRLVPDAVFAERIEAIADTLQSSGAPVIVCNIPDLGHAPAAKVAQAWLGITPEQISDRILELNRAIAPLATRPGFAVVDLFGASQRTIPKRGDIFCSDGFHPSAAGYEQWADEMWPAVWSVASAWLAGSTGVAKAG